MAVFIDFHRAESGYLEKVKKAQHKCPEIPDGYDVKSHQCWVLPEAKKSGYPAEIDFKSGCGCFTCFGNCFIVKFVDPASLFSKSGFQCFRIPDKNVILRSIN